MCIRSEDGHWDAPEGLTFREWIRTGVPRPPTQEDLDYHVTTLFPPVRPRGHLELRMIDAQSGDAGWIVPLAVTAALFDDPEATERAYRIVKSLAETAGSRPAPRNPLWRHAARAALTDPELHTAAVACFAAAQEALPRLGASPRCARRSRSSPSAMWHAAAAPRTIISTPCMPRRAISSLGRTASDPRSRAPP